MPDEIQLPESTSVPPLSEGATDYLMDLFLIHGVDGFAAALREAVIARCAPALTPEQMAALRKAGGRE